MEDITENDVQEEVPASASPSPAIAPEIVSFQIHELKNHPLSDAIYGTEVGEDLLESIRTLGVLQPILVVKDSLEIISGNSRVKAALTLGYEVIQGTYFSSDNDLEIKQAVLESNSQRVKTNEQKIREYNARKTIESELTLLRKAAANPAAKPTKAATREAKGAAREKAAKKSGVSANAADKAVKVIEEADRLKDEGKVEESTELINALNKSINTAHKMVKQKDAPADAPPSKPKAPESVVSLPVVTGGPQEIFSQDDAIASAKAIVRFLRRHDASDFTPDQSVEWYQLANEISGRLRELKIL
jgi:ParB-like chromosome segregation protein Spo0J